LATSLFDQAVAFFFWPKAHWSISPPLVILVGQRKYVPWLGILMAKQLRYSDQITGVMTSSPMQFFLFRMYDFV